MTGKRLQTIVGLMIGAAAALTVPGSWARDEAPLTFDLPEQNLSDALSTVARRAGWELYMAAARVSGLKAPALNGELSAREAIEKLLLGSGLGPNATLTLLNGNRLSYTGLNSAIDIAAIPAAAVDRVEIIADGASAIYGADAVAGVVNVVLKRDYEGLSALGRLGASTDGGNFQQQYSLTGGHRWASGGVLAVYDYSSNSAISAGSRSYTSAMASDSYLYPRLGRHSALVSAHQDIGASVSANVDLLFKDGRQDMLLGFLTGLPHGRLGLKCRCSTDICALVERAAA